MKSWKIIIVFVNILFVISLYCCVPDEIILHGDISGYVSDAENSQPLQAVSIELNQSNVTAASTSTSSDGLYILKKLRPGNYEIQASKPIYEKATKNVTVNSEFTTEINFALNGIPRIVFSDTYLDFGLDSTINSFTISNSGKGELIYFLTTNQDWITVTPSDGEATTETDTFKVTIDRTGLSENKQKVEITIISIIGQNTQVDTVNVFVNGVFDTEMHYYGMVTIGTQTWMAENLNSGSMIYLNDGAVQTNNDIIEKYCYEDLESNCDIYGGSYLWDEMMDWHPEDNGIVGTTQGICPAGWHIPTDNEWRTLESYLSINPGGKMKDTSSLWRSPNVGATNESGFTALPRDSRGEVATIWKSELREFTTNAEYIRLYNNSADIDHAGASRSTMRAAVRCIKDL